MTSNRDLARTAWAPGMPDWIEALARACDAANQTAVAASIGYSRTAISLLVNNKYDRDQRPIERAIREQLMRPPMIACPVQGVGEINEATCRANQLLPFSATNPTRVALYRGCRSGCVHAISTERKAS